MDWSSPLITPYVPPRGVLTFWRPRGGREVSNLKEGARERNRTVSRETAEAFAPRTLLQRCCRCHAAKGSRNLRETEKRTAKATFEIEGEEGGPN